MKIYCFGADVGRRIDRYESSGLVISKIAHLVDEAVVNCAHLDSGGVIGYHRATLPQLFLVVQGQGWVRGESTGRISIQTGEASYWEKGEWHESGTETGMTVIIIEGSKFDPAELMPTV